MPLELSFPAAKFIGYGGQLYSPVEVKDDGIVVEAITPRGESLGRPPMVVTEAIIVVRSDDWDEYVQHLRENPPKKSKQSARKPTPINC
ncbi:MAG: hypothetical protein IT410_04670 [Candidatus Doudnabacteria bacterium]|nr:hypothetical protein [Candidatus Doudnabacteria bacterium]